MALVRARMAEKLAFALGMPDRSASMFRIGLFSSLDVILRRPLEGVLKELSLEEDLYSGDALARIQSSVCISLSLLTSEGTGALRWEPSQTVDRESE